MSYAADTAKIHSGTITEVFDGDTIQITKNNDKKTIRLAYIDAPELNQKYGDRAKRNLYKSIINKNVTYKTLNQDVYNRDVAVVFLGDINLNKKQVHDGYAWSTNRSSSNSYLSLELQARHYKKGLWQSETFLFPSIFRNKYLNDNIR